MGFGFVHTADWQIGKPIRMFEDKLAGLLEEARLAIVDCLAKVARDHDVRHVLVAGDMYDSNRPSQKILRQPLERMKRYKDIQWVLLPGNHDPVEEAGVWGRVLNEGLPDNIKVLLKPEVCELAPGVCVLPSPFGHSGAASDPTSWMAGAETPEGALRIGLAHGSVIGFGSDSAHESLIDPQRAVSANLDYLALGDWHGAKKINARTWYSGTPEPDRFADNDPGHALVVNISAHGVAPEVQQVATAQYVWAKLDVELGASSDTSRVDRAIKELTDDPRRILLRLKVFGDVSASDLHAIDDWRARLEPKLQYLKVDDSSLRVQGDVDDISEIRQSQELGDVFRELQEIAARDEDAHAAVAREALRHLMRYASAAVRGDL